MNDTNTAASSWPDVAARLVAALRLGSPPLAISFVDAPPAGVATFDAPFAEPTPDGRTGRVPAGCVFWVHAAERTFSTVGADHGNCSVGSLTHGFLDLATAAGRADVAALVESGWVTPDVFPSLPVVAQAPGAVVYGPLADTPVDPDVILLRLHPAALMTIADAEPGLAIEGKPQCHIIAMAKEQGRVAASVGCALSRARTGMKPTDMTCAIPAAGAGPLLDRIEAAATIDAGVARYATTDARRFSTRSG